jgi:hypothetical protein
MYLRSAVLILGLAALSACADNAAGPRTLPRRPDAAASVSSRANLVLHVDASAPSGGDGSGRNPYQSLSDAVTRANTEGGAQIVVSPGTYPVSSTIRIETPISILGSNVMTRDSDGLPTGVVAAGTESRIVAASTAAADTIFIVSRVDGGIIRGVYSYKLTFHSHNGNLNDQLFDNKLGIDDRDKLM